MRRIRSWFAASASAATAWSSATFSRSFPYNGWASASTSTSRWRRPWIWRTSSSTRACTSFPCRWTYTPPSTVLAVRRSGSTVRIRWRRRRHPTTSGQRWARASPGFFVTAISVMRRSNRWWPWLPTVTWWRMSNRRWSISTGWTWPTLWGAGTSSTRILFTLGQWISKAEFDEILTPLGPPLLLPHPESRFLFPPRSSSNPPCPLPRPLPRPLPLKSPPPRPPRSPLLSSSSRARRSRSSRARVSVSRAFRISSFFCSRKVRGTPAMSVWASRSNFHSAFINVGVSFVRKPVKFICIFLGSGVCKNMLG